MCSKVADRLHSESSDQCFLPRLAVCYQQGPLGINTVLLAGKHLHKLSAWRDWKYALHVYWWCQNGWWGGLVRRESPLSEKETGRKSEPVRTVWSLTKASARSCTWDDITKKPSAGWDLCGWEQPFCERPGGPEGQQYEHESGCSNKGKSSPGLHPMRALLAEIKMWSPSVFSMY